MNNRVDLSIILPLFNEEKRFEEQEVNIKKILNQHPNWEIICVDDGSSDSTVEKVRGFKIENNIKIVSYYPNKGKGYAIKRGVEAATGDLILFSDIDFSTPITELKLFIPEIKKGADIVIGSRKVSGAQVKKHQNRLREWMGKQFTYLSNILLGLNVSDFTCGFKLFKHNIAKEIFAKAKVNRWGFDSEILFLAHKLDYKVRQIPVIWENDERTKVNLFKDIYRSLSDLITIRYNDLLGKYD